MTTNDLIDTIFSSESQNQEFLLKDFLSKHVENSYLAHSFVQALFTLKGIRRVRIKTDSQFTINCITKWIQKWKTNNWKVANGENVKNKEDLLKLDNIRNKMLQVDWVHIKAHQGEAGNEEADKLAKAGAVLYKKNH